jgi:hypothetical protein
MGPRGGSTTTLVAADLAFLEGGGGMVCAERREGKEQAQGDSGNSQNLTKLFIWDTSKNLIECHQFCKRL